MKQLAPAPPLSEWLDDVSNDDTIFTTLPTFVNPKEYDENNHQRSWDLLASDNKKVLKLKFSLQNTREARQSA